MEVVVNLLIWIHLLALAAGGATTFGMPVAGRGMATATPEQRPALLALMKRLSTIGRAAIGTLIVTGLLIVWLDYGGFGTMNVWFWIKMVLVVALLAGVIYGGITFKRGSQGDAAAAKLGPRIGMVNMVLFFGIVLAAVFAFA